MGVCNERSSVINAAMALPPEARAELAERLLESLEDSQSEVNAAWAKEVQDRIAVYERGEVKGIPAEEVFRSIRNRSQS